MLVLSRHANEAIVIGKDIVVQVLSIEGRTVRIGINAPDDVGIARGEVLAEGEAALPKKGRLNKQDNV